MFTLLPICIDGVSLCLICRYLEPKTTKNDMASEHTRQASQIHVCTLPGDEEHALYI